SDIQDKIGIIANESVKTLQGINSLLEDETFIEGLRTSITNLNSVTAKLDRVITENQQNLKEITESTKEITADTKNLIKENKDKVEVTLANFNSIMLRSDSLLTSLNYLTQETITGGNNLGKILYNDSLYNNLIQSMESINELTKLLKFQLETDGIKVDAYIF
ncbi:MAG: hypothetical protein MUE93_07565, partial [Ignavibacteriaceae bacterium]|nr:hypothetical protein [Ignavibacteriaceae bacterium]